MLIEYESVEALFKNGTLEHYYLSEIRSENFEDELYEDTYYEYYFNRKLYFKKKA